MLDKALPFAFRRHLHFIAYSNRVRGFQATEPEFTDDTALLYFASLQPDLVPTTSRFDYDSFFQMKIDITLIPGF